MEEVIRLLQDKRDWLVIKVKKCYEISDYLKTLPEDIKDFKFYIDKIYLAIDVKMNNRDEKINIFSYIDLNTVCNYLRRGIDTYVFIGIIKCYKNAFIDLIIESKLHKHYKYIMFMNDFFDDLEISFLSQIQKKCSSNENNSLKTDINVSYDKNTYLTVFQSIPNPVILINENFKVENMNFSAMELFKKFDEDSRKNLSWIKEEIIYFIKGDFRELGFTKDLISNEGILFFKVKLKRIEINESKSIIIMMDDITYSKKVTQQLEKSEKDLKEITDNMLDFICKVNIKGVIGYVSPSFKNFFGYKYKDIIGGCIYKFVHPDDIDMVIKNIDESITNKHGSKIEYRFKHYEDYYIWVETVNNLLFDNDGNINGFIYIIREVRDRKNKITTKKQLYCAIDKLTKNKENIVDSKQAMEIINGDEMLFRELLNVFIYDFPKSIIKIKEHIDSRDFEILKQDIHELKDATANIGIKTIYNIALDIEDNIMSRDIEGVKNNLGKIQIEVTRLQSMFSGLM